VIGVAKRKRLECETVQGERERDTARNENVIKLYGTSVKASLFSFFNSIISPTCSFPV